MESVSLERHVIDLGPFKVEAPFVDSVKDVLACRELETLVSEVAKKYTTIQVFGDKNEPDARWEKNTATIYLNPNLGNENEVPLESIAAKTFAIIFELFNALHSEDYEPLFKQVMNLSEMEFVVEMEVIEHRIAKMAQAKIEEIKRNIPRYRLCPHIRFFDDASQHVVLQEINQHSARVRQLYRSITGRPASATTLIPKMSRAEAASILNIANAAFNATPRTRSDIARSYADQPARLVTGEPTLAQKHIKQAVERSRKRRMKANS